MRLPRASIQPIFQLLELSIWHSPPIANRPPWSALIYLSSLITMSRFCVTKGGSVPLLPAMTKSHSPFAIQSLRQACNAPSPTFIRR